MKLFFYSLLFVSFLTVSCTSNKQPEPQTNIEVATITEAVTLKSVENYFSVLKPTEKKELILTDSTEFSASFNPAATMGNIPTKIDFSKEKIGAIILPETEFETTINIDSAYVLDRTLNIVYTITKGGEKRSFTIVPCRVFAFDKNIDEVDVVFKEK